MKFRILCILVALLLLCSCQSKEAVNNSDNSVSDTSTVTSETSSESVGFIQRSYVCEGGLSFESFEDLSAKVSDGSYYEMISDIFTDPQRTGEDELWARRRAPDWILKYMVYEMYLDGEKLALDHEYMDVELLMYDWCRTLEYIVCKEYPDESELRLLVRIHDPNDSNLVISSERWDKLKEEYTEERDTFDIYTPNATYCHKLKTVTIDGKEMECLIPDEQLAEEKCDSGFLVSSQSFAIYYNNEVIIEFGVDLLDNKAERCAEFDRVLDEDFFNKELSFPSEKYFDIENFIERVSFKKVEFDYRCSEEETKVYTHDELKEMWQKNQQ